MALNGVVVLEFAGLAPVPFCGMILRDFGAQVIRIDRHNSSYSTDQLTRGKMSIGLNLKSKEAISMIKQIISKKKVDVILDPFRPGVMEKLGIGPKVLCELNPQLIYARLTGWGQPSRSKNSKPDPISKTAGHDVNYISLSGALSLISRSNSKPLFPLNLLGDFAGGSLMCVIGVLLALYDREKTGKGNVIDAAMLDGVNYLNSFLYYMIRDKRWDPANPGTNLLDSGAYFYEVYQARDGKYISVGALEPKFYVQMIAGLERGIKLAFEKYKFISNEDRKEVTDEFIKLKKANQINRSAWPQNKKRMEKIIALLTRDEWIDEVYSNRDGSLMDACVAPVLNMSEIESHRLTKHRNLVQRDGDEHKKGPSPAPKFSRPLASKYRCFLLS